ncbi:MAG: asparaginase [Archangium sp.]|nr:asparaginase [Archangium sp.]
MHAVECTRGGHRESIHPFSAVVVERGAVTWSVGDDVSTFWRSACKPFQLSNSLGHLNGLSARDFSDDELAIGAASHSGQPQHVALVEKLLARFGLSAEQLQCGGHPPMHESSAKRVETPGNLHNNCSGKHTFMLAACKAQGWDLDYRAPTHPLQVKNRALLEGLGGHALQLGVDGCSIPTFFAPLSAMARTWSRLAEAMSDDADSTLGRIGLAMHRSPFFVSGDERLDLRVTQGANEWLAVKVGAEGLFCIARPEKRQGIAVKVHSGNADVAAVAVKWVLAQQGVNVQGEWPWSVVKNVRGVEVGARAVVTPLSP